MISVFELFTIGIGPSSSHTVGPMRAAAMFVDGLARAGSLERVAAVSAEMFGSLGATGRGHGTPKAVLLGLEVERPHLIDPDRVEDRLQRIRSTGRLRSAGRHDIAFDVDKNLVLHRRRSLPGHPNGMRFRAEDAGGQVLAERVYYSVGGGFVVDDSATDVERRVADTKPVPYPFRTAAELLHLTRSTGGLEVRRRAADLAHQLETRTNHSDPLNAMDWITLYALAVNEENTAGGRAVTAPTNGAAGIIPAVLSYYLKFVPGASHDGVVRFLLIGGLVQIPCIERNAVAAVKAITAARLALRGDGQHHVSLDRVIRTKGVHVAHPRLRSTHVHGSNDCDSPAPSTPSPPVCAHVVLPGPPRDHARRHRLPLPQ
jgi:L-serine dehydratase